MKNFSHTIATIFKSKAVRIILLSIIGVCIALLVFSAGVAVGVRKTEFRHGLSDNYQHNFGMISRTPGTFGNIAPGDNFPNPHGAAGRIIKVSLPTFIVESVDGVEKVVHITDTTHIKTIQGIGTTQDIVPEDTTVVIGEPNDQGQIDATFIRILPPTTN